MPSYTFKFKIGKLEDLEVEIKGERDDVRTAQNLLEKLTGAAQPAQLLETSVDGNAGSNGHEQPRTIEGRVKARRSRKSSNSNGNQEAENSLPNYSHNTDKWGFPKQAWPTAKRAMWLLEVLFQESGISDGLDSETITAIFNRHFKEAGVLLKHNVTRDLNKEKVAKNVGTANNKYFLTTQGRETAQKLVAEAKS